MRARLIFFSCLMTVAGLTGCSPQGGNPLSSGNADPVRIARVERRDLNFTVEAVGDLRPSIQVDVKTEISGTIKTLSAQTGQMIKRGDLLLTLDDRDLLTEKSSAETEIEGAKLLLQKATLAAQRAQQLAASDLISKQDADNLRLDADVAKNNLEKAVKKLQTVQNKLSKTRINAPIDGSVIFLPVVEGQVVVGGPTAGASTLLMTLANLSEMLISTHMNQMDVTRMKEEQPVHVTLDAFETLNFSGKVCFIAPMATIKNNIKGFAVDILVSSADSRIRPGMSANVRIPISRATSALTVPIEAVFREGDKRVVFLKGPKGMERREVEVGIVTTEYAEIKAGLKEGDSVRLNHSSEDEKKGDHGAHRTS